MNNTINRELQSHLLRLYEIACADKNFDILEMKQLYKFAAMRGVSTEHLDNLLTHPPQHLEVPASIEKRLEYLYDLAIMIWVDKVVTADEYDLLKKYAETFDFLPQNIPGLCDYLIDCARNERPLQEVLNPSN